MPKEQSKKHDLPAMPFYVGDWLKCPEVRSLSPDCRGLWFDLICFMWESTERGVMVKPNGKPYSDEEIIRMVGLDNQNSGIWLTTLLDNNVCGRREDGAIFSRRMLKEEKIRVLRRESGLKGGNPKLLVNHILKQEVNQFVENESEYESNPSLKDKRMQGEKESDRLNDFNKFFESYPSKVARSRAISVFFAFYPQVDPIELLKAVDAYKGHLKSNTWKKAMNADKFLEEWPDWVNYIEPEKEETDEQRNKRLIAQIRAK